MELVYKISNKKVTINGSDSLKFFRGNKECLSKKGEDITKNTSWFTKGYKVFDYSSILSYEKLIKSLTYSVKNIIRDNFHEINLDNFNLENYHKFISVEQHLKIDKNLKRLYPKDFGFDNELIVNFIGKILGVPLSYKSKFKDLEHWIILRISLPESTGVKGFNPAHKDIYEDYDQLNIIPRMVNAWIPICGVNNKTGLAIVPGSHLLEEEKIVRTKAGSIIENQIYSVNCIKSWNNSNSMELISPKPGFMLLFSSHLIHGLGINNNLDKTRISLEFRLHKV